MADNAANIAKELAKELQKANQYQTQLNAAGIGYEIVLNKQAKAIEKVNASLKNSVENREKDEKLLEKIKKAEFYRSKKGKADLKKMSNLEKDNIKHLLKQYLRMDKVKLEAEKTFTEEKIKLAEEAITKEMGLLAKANKKKEKLLKYQEQAKSSRWDQKERPHKARKTVGALGDLFGARGINPLDWASRGESAGGKFGDIAKELEKKRIAKAGILGKAPGEAKGLEKVLGGLSKAGPFLAVAAAVTSLIKGMVDLESFMTELNKSFLKMAGPTVGIGNIPKEMKNFNDAIFDLQRNLKLGIKSKDIQDMFSAIAGAGMSLTSAKQKMGSYGDAIKDVRYLSLELGESMTKTGDMIVKQMLNMKSSFDVTKSSLRSIAYDASKAGVTLDKFYGSIESSVMSLSYFGNYVKSTGTLLSSFTQSAELGFDDAAKAANNMVQAFSGVDYKKGMKAFLVMGEKTTKELFNQVSLEANDRIKDIKTQIDTANIQRYKAPEGDARDKISDNIEKLNEDLRKEEARQATLDTAMMKANKGDFSDLGMQLGRLADKPVEVMMKILKIAGDYTPAQVELLSNILGVSQETLLHTKESIRETQKTFKELTSGSNKEVLDGMIKGNKDLADNFKALLEARAKGGSGAEFRNEFQDKLVEMFKKQYGEDEARKRASVLVSTLNKGIDQGLLGPFESYVDKILAGTATGGEGISDEDTYKVLEQGNKLSDKSMKTEQTVIDKLINKTTSSKDYFEISKEALKYVGADATNGFLKELNLHAVGMLGYLGIMSRDKEKDALKDLDNYLKNTKAPYNKEDIPEFIKAIKNNQDAMDIVVDDFTKKRQATDASYTTSQGIKDLNTLVEASSKGAKVSGLFAGDVKQYSIIKKSLDGNTQELADLKSAYSMHGLGYMIPGEEDKVGEENQPIEDKKKVYSGFTDAVFSSAEKLATGGKYKSSQEYMGTKGMTAFSDAVAQSRSNNTDQSQSLIDSRFSGITPLPPSLLKGTGGASTTPVVNIGGITINGNSTVDQKTVNMLRDVFLESLQQAYSQKNFKENTVK